MRILIYGLNFAPELTGIGKYTGELAKFLVDNGHDVHVITTPPYYPQWRVTNGYSSTRYQISTVGVIKIIRCPIWVPQKPSGVKRLLHLTSFAISSLPVGLAELFWKPDVIFSVAPTLFCGPFALILSKLSGAKSWLHIQDFELDAAFSLGVLPARDVLHKIATKFESSIFRGFDRVSTISSNMQGKLIEKGADPSKTELLVNWVDTEVIFPLNRSSPLRRELGFSENTQIILYAGNLGKKQNLDILIDVAKDFPPALDVMFVLVGAGSARHDLKSKASGLKNIKFFPLQPSNRLNDLLNLANIHILPQQRNAADLVMPSKLSAIIASGRPVIATAQPGTEVYKIVENVGIVVPPEDHCALSDAIQKILCNMKHYVSLAELGRAYAINNWDKRSVLRDFKVQIENLATQS